MKVKQSTVSNTLYQFTGEIPSTMLVEPNMKYWISVRNIDGKIQESPKFTIGVKPDYPVNAAIQLTTKKNEAMGETLRSSIRVFTQAEGPVFGTLYLLADGETVFEQTDVFKPGEVVLNVPWTIPKDITKSTFNLKAGIQIYDKVFETKRTTLNVFQPKLSLLLDDVIEMNPITDVEGNIIAWPTQMYSSSIVDSVRFKIISPEGICVVGQSDDCKIKDRTRSHKGNFESIIINDQVFRVSYSGPDNILERFSIKTVDPIIGSWSIQLEMGEKDPVPLAHAIENTRLKVFYEEKELVITVSSSNFKLISGNQVFSSDLTQESPLRKTSATNHNEMPISFFRIYEAGLEFKKWFDEILFNNPIYENVGAVGGNFN